MPARSEARTGMSERQRAKQPAQRAAIEAIGLGQRYRRAWALRDCTFTVPAGRVVGLVGPNGAGKTTLLHALVGLLHPTVGRVRIFGQPPASALHRVAFVAQEKPLYPWLTVAETLRAGRELNPRWDAGLARERIARLAIPTGRRVGQLSGGQQAQVALTVALAKGADLIVLDEPVANLDPIGRHDVMRDLMAAAAGAGLTVVLSSHVLSDLEETCDHLVLLGGGRVRLAGDIGDILAQHAVLTGRRELAGTLAATPHTVVRVSQTDRQATAVIRVAGPVHDPRADVRVPTLEEIVLAYMRAEDSVAAVPRPTLASTVEES
jgi:ABC-2 type transport system ATP-binding protein